MNIDYKDILTKDQLKELGINLTNKLSQSIDMIDINKIGEELTDSAIQIFTDDPDILYDVFSSKKVREVLERKVLTIFKGE